MKFLFFFFKAYSLEEARHIVKREWFKKKKKIYSEIVKGNTPTQTKKETKNAL